MTKKNSWKLGCQFNGSLFSPEFMFHYTTRLPALGSEERAAKYKTVGATATAFVTDQEQTRDVEAGFLRGNLGPESAIRKWFKIENANLI